jgi:hypothetical protein
MADRILARSKPALKAAAAKRNETGRDRALQKLKALAKKPLADIVGLTVDDTGIVAELARDTEWERTDSLFYSALGKIESLCEVLDEPTRLQIRAELIKVENAYSDQWVRSADNTFNAVTALFLRDTPIGKALGIGRGGAR